MKQSVAVAILCIIVAIQALTDEQKQLLRQHSRKCVAETGIDDGIVRSDPTELFSPNQKHMEYVFCLLKASGIVNDNGDPIPANVKKKLGNDYTVMELEYFLRKCPVKASTPIEKVAEFWLCYWDTCKKQIT